MDENRYKIRSIAGVHFLVDTMQSGNPYRAPFKMNDMGEEIFSLYQKGADENEITKKLCEEYEAEKELIYKDVSAFLEKLKKYLAKEV